MTRQQPTAPQPVAAFFDVDNTIVRGASAFHIARGLKQRGYFRNRDLIRFGWEQLKYLILGESHEQMAVLKHEALSFIKGFSVAEMAAIGEEVYDEVIALRIFPGTKAIIDEHRAQGHQVWFVTATPVEVGRLIGRLPRKSGAGYCRLRPRCDDGRIATRKNAGVRLRVRRTPHGGCRGWR